MLSVIAELEDDALVVIGSDLADTIDIRQVGEDLFVNHVTRDAAKIVDRGELSFAASAVKSIRVDGRDGDDAIRFSNPSAPDRFDVRLIGGAGDDTIISDGANVTMVGGAGNDVLEGRGGVVTLDYGDSPRGINADLMTGVVSQDGYGYIDRVSGAKNVYGSEHSDFIRGDRQNNVLVGRGDSDTILGEAGVDTIVGGPGGGYLDGGSGSDGSVQDIVFANPSATATGGWVVRYGDSVDPALTRYSYELFSHFIDEYGFIVYFDSSIYQDETKVEGWTPLSNPLDWPSAFVDTVDGKPANASTPYGSGAQNMNVGIGNVHGRNADAALGYALLGEEVNSARLLNAIDKYGFDSDGTPIRFPLSSTVAEGDIAKNYPRDDFCEFIAAAHAVLNQFGIQSDAGRIAQSVLTKHSTAMLAHGGAFLSLRPNLKQAVSYSMLLPDELYSYVDVLSEYGMATLADAVCAACHKNG